ncbi:MAG: FHA domain-containing protein [Gemmataceae bacterium]|nr:FHA domain-containing protein [Gemmataceae bacterium]
MRILLTVTAGPHEGQEFSFDRHDTFLVGRSKHAHFQLLAKDKYFSRIHFMMEVNPPECRLIDMGSHNGTYVNGAKVLAADLKDGDQIRAGHTTLRVQVRRDERSEDDTALLSRFEDPAAPDALPNVPGYVLERELGRGAMGVTYLGRRPGQPALYALKVVKPSFQGSQTQVNDFLRAARFLSQLDHPHILRLSEVGGCTSGYYFVSEFFPGRNAGEILEREGPLPIQRAVGWANQMLQALSYAHAKHFIHHDIRPTNVLVAAIDGKEVVKLADYAVARVYQAAPFSGLSVTAALVNLASFMPPELLFNYQEVNPLADQYSVAAVLYHLLSGQPVLDLPKEERKRYSSLLRHQYVPLRDHRPEVPPALAVAIHRALSRTPGQRFKDIAEFRQALMRAVG